MIVTGGVWGAILYTIQAGLALANFTVNVGKIKSATYAFSNNPDMETTRGSVVKGCVFEDKINEINILRTRACRLTRYFR